MMGGPGPGPYRGPPPQGMPPGMNPQQRPPPGGRTEIYLEVMIH